ncbi:cytochrome b [Vandammella animalimorsus]|uniref:Cytochrome b n=1 Tax=Vandammella animalimorsus TaxID=2029117 RepID=A0A3M6RKA9_9BURK|nr:cytochrome b [Vandammella animalimorsus]RMX15358.1 cytochrome b [Vandammella animalimorsus]
MPAPNLRRSHLSAAPAALPWRDSPLRFGRISRLLHWAMALLLAWQFVGMALKLAFDLSPRDSWLVGTHNHVGVVLWLLAVLRALWALAQWPQRPAYGPGVIAQCARAGHGLLYLLMLLVPTLALLRLYASGRAFALFGQWPIFSASAPNQALVQAINAPRDSLGASWHGLLGWLLLAVIAGHIAMVLVHHFIWRDDTARRMLGRRGPNTTAR